MLAGRRAHIIFDSKLVSQVHRLPKTITFEPTGINVAFGVPHEDNEIMMSKISDRGEGDYSGYQDLHNSLIGTLEGENLERMIQFFITQLNKNLDREFASDCQRAHSEPVDLCALVKRHYTLAAIPYLFGTRILDMWPTLNEDFWHFDSHLMGLTLPLPAFANRKGNHARQKMIDGIRCWEDRATTNRPLPQVEKTDPDWDDYWGERLTRERYRLLLERGLSERGRAGFHLGLLWAQNANTVPIGLWMLIQTILDPVLHGKVRGAAESCRKADGTFDLHALVTNPILKSLFLEALRFGVAVAPVRAVTESTLLGGQYHLQKGDLVFLPARPAQTDAGIWSSSFSGMKAMDSRSDPRHFWAERFMEYGEIGEDQPITAGVMEMNSSPRTVGSRRVEALSLPAGVRSKQLRSQLSHVRPFGGGHWLCPGRNLSMYEIIAGLAVLICRFDIQAEEAMLQSQGRPCPDFSRVGGMDPDRPIIVRVRPR
ncbi:Cholesterol 7-alpha-monooxygenase [Penicillium subrubescens]|uniref:Cholesterol 7-alpha-monooxygenase n=2 Tax=Penicillium subrubescens TaxID=1316194 RepID=A0A1Q5UKD2_9EURO|nr:Cholesterol 7-alpha-monooxygenase [Penicillium subrubescens]